ncbi:hypothetical protein like AT4G27290 [Hibiscus trionum]|uniref:Receptor-like serine/threonine-protein kinase n=1 Tax=Hibiscus trionum TaxID=183268 RepID=A0A9W7J944_HIBTR|nr:hypothetical protein like AT4G27290 [Hibiscus trionum]
MELLLCLFIFFFPIIRTSTTQDIIFPGKSIKDGETLISAGGSFELGFFSPGSSKNRYVGIWYKNVSSGTVVWVANRETPVSDKSGVLSVTGQGILTLLDGKHSLVWSSNMSKPARSPVVQLLESGNLVVQERNDNNLENTLWESFDYPCDNFLPEMKIGRNFITGFERYISSWKSTEDPAPGDYSIRIDARGYPQFVLKKGSEVVFRGGSWNGLYFTVNPRLERNPVFSYDFVLNSKEVYCEYKNRDSLFVSRLQLNPLGSMQHSIWNNRKQDWEIFSTALSERCATYAFCGPYATCTANKFPPCACLEGYVAKSITSGDPGSVDSSDGCVRMTPLNCDGKDRFFKHTRLKLPDTSHAWANNSISLHECEELCLTNCSCTAYATLDIFKGTGCLIWFNDLIDMAEFDKGGQDLYVRLAASELDRIQRKTKPKEKLKVAIISISSVVATGLLMLVFVLYVQKKWADEETEEMELPMMVFKAVANATNNFSMNNLLGRGGFGAVYKGILEGGQEVAVKRLSKNSGQGLEEFKNEVTLIVKLQHRNLVKLLGCCIKEDERMLIYEYMPNKSLDCFIFDRTRNKELNWHRRMNIIDGIARGLLYIHHDSRLRIIHRDLKASNILLDNSMNPKISDFGLARKFGGDQTEARTKRVVGTYGYMSPEYAFRGHFSMKSDVFSFGVLVLEIVTGKRNRGFSDSNHDHNLLGHAWSLWIADRPLELIDNALGRSYNVAEVLRCINVALLCVQQRPEDRPNMSSVVLMLCCESPLAHPKQPGFFLERPLPQAESAVGNQESLDESTITELEPR